MKLLLDQEFTAALIWYGKQPEPKCVDVTFYSRVAKGTKYEEAIKKGGIIAEGLWWRSQWAYRESPLAKPIRSCFRRVKKGEKHEEHEVDSGSKPPGASDCLNEVTEKNDPATAITRETASVHKPPTATSPQPKPQPTADVDWTTRSNKAPAREMALGCGSGHLAALFLPGEQLCCVRSALDSDLISLATYLVVVEREPGIAEKIRNELVAMGFDPHSLYIHTDELCALDLTAALGGRKLSYAFFDFCGVLTYSIVSWYATNLTPENVEHGVNLSFTHNTCGRSGKKGSFIESSLTSHRLATSIVCRAERCIQSPDIHRCLSETNKRHQNRRVLQIVVTLGALTQFDAEVVDCECYRDNASMMTFNVRLGEPRKISDATRVLGDMVNQARWGAMKSGEMFQHISKRAPSGLTPAKKSVLVKQAKKGERPRWLTQDEWLDCSLNPKKGNMFFGLILQGVKVVEEKEADSGRLEKAPSDIKSKEVVAPPAPALKKEPEWKEVIRVTYRDGTHIDHDSFAFAADYQNLSIAMVRRRLTRVSADKQGRTWSQVVVDVLLETRQDIVLFVGRKHLSINAAVGKLEDVKAFYGPNYTYEVMPTPVIPSGFIEPKTLQTLRQEAEVLYGCPRTDMIVA